MEAIEFLDHRASWRTSQPRNLANVKAPLGMQQQQGQGLAPVLRRKEKIRQRDFCCLHRDECSSDCNTLAVLNLPASVFTNR